ncbi:transposase [Micromonospora haikouensis]
MRSWPPDELWQMAQPLMPAPAKRPQGGGRRRADDRAVLAAIVYLAQAG